MLRLRLCLFTALLSALLLALAGCMAPKPVEVVKHAPWPTKISTPSPTVAPPTATRTSIVKSWRPTPPTFVPRPTATITPTPFPPQPPPTEPITAENIHRLVPYARIPIQDEAAWPGGLKQGMWFNGGQRLAILESQVIQIYAAPRFDSDEPVTRLELQTYVSDMAVHDEYGALAMYHRMDDLVVWDLVRNQQVGRIWSRGFNIIQGFFRLPGGTSRQQIFRMKGPSSCLISTVS